MIHYELRCDRDHAFDGWFKDSAAFEQQAGHGLLECPVCASASVTRALMSPALAKGAPAPAQPKPPPAAAPEPSEAPKMPDQVRAVLQRMRSEIEQRCDYVGPAFADEARKIRRGEAEKRGIYGEASPAEAQALAEDGIEVSRIPWVPRAEG